MAERSPVHNPPNSSVAAVQFIAEEHLESLHAPII